MILKKEHISKVFAFLIILIMGVYVLNKTLYTHTHILADGSITTHAHPFQKSVPGSPVGQHTHSSLDFILLDKVKALFTCLFIAIEFLTLFTFITYLSPVQNKREFDFYSAVYLRGPPRY